MEVLFISPPLLVCDMDVTFADTLLERLYPQKLNTAIAVFFTKFFLDLLKVVSGLVIKTLCKEPEVRELPIFPAFPCPLR